MAKAEPLVIKLIIQGEKKLKPTEARLNKIKDLVNSIDKVSTNLFDGRSVKGGVKALTELKEKLGEAAAGNRKFAENFSGLNRQLGKFQTIIRESKTETKQFTDAIVAAERVQQKLFSARGAQAQALARSYGKGGLGADLIPNLMSQMDSSEFIKSRDALSNYRSELTRVFDAVEIGSENYETLGAQIRKVDGLLGRLPKANKITGVGSGLAGKEQALKEALRIQNQLETGSDAHIKSIVGTRKAQQAYNQELRISKTIQSALNLDLIVWKKLLDSVPALMGRIAGGMKGLFMGKFGKLGQAAGVIGVSSAIEQLIQKIPFLDQGLKNNIQRWASWTQRAVEGITGVTIAWTALSGLLGGAQWVVGAVKGFAEFESAAARVIWSVEGNITRAFSLFGRLARELPSLASAIATVMPGSLGGLGVGGSPFAWMAEGSASGQVADALGGGSKRKESRRYTRQGPTELQNAQKDLNKLTQMLEQRNVTERDYITLLQKQQNAKQKISRIEDDIKQKQIEAGTAAPSELFKEEYDEFKNQTKRQVDEKRKAAKAVEQLERQEYNARKKIQSEAARDYAKAEADKQKLHKQRINQAIKDEKRLRREQRQAREKRKAALSRFGENVMLGAGFPMLFGGGAGAVAGGLTGAVAQSAMGSKGFGAQILFSAIGQQVDAFVAKISDLGKAFNTINPDVDAVIAALGETNTAYGKHLEMLKKIEGEAAAMAEAERAMLKIIGAEGLGKIKEFGQDATNLGNAWQKVMLRMQASIAALITRTGILKALAESMAKGTAFQKANLAVVTGTASPELQALWDAYERQNTRMGALENTFRNAPFRPLNEDGSFKFPSQRELRPMIADQYRKDQANLQTGDLLGSGADKAASLQKEIDLLEKSLAIGSKAAGQEQEAAEILKEQNRTREEKLKLNETDILQQIQTRDKLKEQLELWEQIKDTIATGLTSAIQGLIDGTKSLGESLASIAKSIGSMLLQSAISGWLAPIGLPKVNAAEGMYMANGIKPFAYGGVATRPTLGLVGEAGEDEYIIPASKMAASMQRYSAGARAGENRTLSTLRNSRSARSRLGM